jgi:hypothetical protein
MVCGRFPRLTPDGVQVQVGLLFLVDKHGWSMVVWQRAFIEKGGSSIVILAKTFRME